MKLEIYGGTKDYEHFTAHGESTDEHLKPCPFCGSTDAVEVVNTHTPHYWARCSTELGGCGAEGPPGEAPGYKGNHIKTKKTCEKHHRASFEDAVRRWNERA